MFANASFNHTMSVGVSLPHKNGPEAIDWFSQTLNHLFLRRNSFAYFLLEFLLNIIHAGILMLRLAVIDSLINVTVDISIGMKVSVVHVTPISNIWQGTGYHLKLQ